MAKKITDWDQIIGHKNVISLLKRKIEKDTIQDFMIFHGNPGLGKSSITKLLAIEVVTRYESDELKQEYIKAVIEENISTDSIKLFNMSEIQDKEEMIQKVKAELTIGFSKTKRKVLILDEAHNMSKQAQDAILTDLEHLPKGLYVFLCTTELGCLRDAVLSRGSKGKIHLKNLSEAETRRLIKEEIIERHLQFDISLDVVVALITEYCGNRPRDAYNLIESFDYGSLVTSKDIEVYVDTNVVPEMIELLKYLYGSLILGIDYISTLRLDDSFATTLVEVCKVAIGGISTRIGPKDTTYIKDFMKGRDTKHIMQFTVEVTGLSTLVKRRVTSAFMRAHVAFQPAQVPIRDYSKSFVQEDMNTLSMNVEDGNLIGAPVGVERIQSLEEIFGAAEVVDE